MIKNEEKYIPKTIINKVEKYNRWAKEERRKNQIWHPKAPREGVKQPFKSSDIYYAKSMKEIESNPVLKNMYEEGIKKGPIE